MPDADDIEPLTTEAQALADILAWSEGRPLWQRDALRRLSDAENLSDDDINELVVLCKDPSLHGTPLTADHIRAPDAGAPPVQLRAIKNVLNVNALAEGQRLNFLQNGVTIVYGDNGSGKSGYVRVLKRACRARGPDESILKNIYTAPVGPQQAEIDYTAGGQDQTAQWTEGQASTPLLSAVSVFDARTANIHVDETNDVAYTPFPMKLLEWLVQACRAIKGNLEAEINAITAQTPHTLIVPDCAEDTAVGRLIAGLSDSTTMQQVERLATLSTEEEARLATLTADLVQDPRATAQRLHAEKRRIDIQITQLQALANAASDASANQLLALWQDYQSKNEAARLVAEDLFADEPLPAVGGKTWHTLWEAARAYSAEAPYPDQPFPFTGDDARCVLCQQDLPQEAAERLRRFEAFVQDRTQQQQIEAQRSFEQYEAALAEAAPAIAELHEILVFIRDELGQAALATVVRNFAINAKWRLRQLMRQRALPATPAPLCPNEELGTTSAELATRATALLADDESDERKTLKQELQALTDRQWFAGIKEDVRDEIDRKKEIAKLRRAIQDTVHTQITNKSSALSEILVTDRLRGRFAQEIDHMHIAGLAIELRKTRTQHGVPLFRVSLIHKPDTKAGQILSEGEHGCVAIAAFLAELSTTDSRSGIVFDDPISSLDHLHREAVAERLADEGRHRQIIVLTHDLVFLFLLEKACQERGTDVALRHVLRRGDEPGHCDNSPPLKAQNADRRAQSLQSHLDNTRFQYEQDPEGAWLITAKGLLGHVRDAWESAVEGAVAPVLRTFSSKIDTRGFAKLTAITQQDAEDMRTAYGRCSTLLHNASDAFNPAVPTPDQIADEITALRTWIDNLRIRQDQI